MQYPLQKGARNSLLSPWASWTFGPGKERAHRATCLLPPSLGHGSRKQAGSRLRVGPTFPTRWREPLSENGGRCILLIKAFSKFPSSPCEEGGGSHRAIVTPSRPEEIAPSRRDGQRAQRRACKVPGLLKLGLLLLIGLQNPILYLNAILFRIKLLSSSTLKLGQPAQRKLWTLNVACATLCQKKRNWKLPIYIGNGRSKNILKNYILELNQKFGNYKN